MAHLIATLTLLFDLDYIVLKQGEDESYRSSLKGLAWGSLTCLIVLFVGLFMGVSMFSRGMNSFYILAHFTGAILTACMIIQGWSIGAYVAIFLFLALFPGVVEFGMIISVAKSYRGK
eukprot:TRINITY_DN932_c1_g1_i1.p3 TRINITY_DN932_c1_g1~~TRINITY_DN932_c1_g1_i1.p3  ORF type:complete len:118 (-),score=8.24 TRINITY_DN932_c1_g1_i1:92-445(-)